MKKKFKNMKKIVMFTSGDSDIFIERLKKITPKHLIISSDYEELLSPEEVLAAAEYALFQAQRKFGLILTDKTAEAKDLVVINTTKGQKPISAPYLKMYHEMSEKVYAVDCDTAAVDLSTKTIDAEKLQNAFFFVSGGDPELVKRLMIKDSDSIFISRGKMSDINNQYITALNDPAFKVMGMDARDFKPEDEVAFSRFPPDKGYGSIQTIKMISDSSQKKEVSKQIPEGTAGQKDNPAEQTEGTDQQRFDPDIQSVSNPTADIQKVASPLVTKIKSIGKEIGAGFLNLFKDQ